MSSSQEEGLKLVRSSQGGGLEFWKWKNGIHIITVDFNNHR
jgi:hypothetical protein